MEKVYVIQKVWVYNENPEISVRVCKTYEDAKKIFNEYKAENQKLIDEIKDIIKNDQDNINNEDFGIDNFTDEFLYVYDNVNFESLTIIISEREVEQY